MTRITTQLIGLLMLAAPLAAGEGVSRAAGGPSAAPTSQPASVPTALPDDVALNLNNVDIDHVLEFLSRLTNKIVMKHKGATAQVFVVSPRKVSRERAVRLIAEALRMEKVALVERGEVLWLVPTSALPEIDIGLAPAEAGAPPVGFVRKVITLRFADVFEVEKLVKPLLSKDATTVPYPPLRQLILTDAADRIASAEGLIAQIDVLGVRDRQVAVFPLTRANAEEIAPIVAAVLAAPKPAAPSGGSPGGPKPSGPTPGPPSGSTPPQPPTAGAEVMAYKAANWLVVIASKEDIAAARQLVEELDKERPEDLKLRVVPLKFAQAADIAPQLMALFQQKPDKRVRDTVQITANERSNVLLVLAADVNFALVEKTVKELDTEQSVQTETRTYELKHADAEDVAQQLNDLYSVGAGGYYYYDWYGMSYRSMRRTAETRFVAEKRTNAIIVIAAPSEFERIEGVIRKLDVAATDQVAPRIYPIKFGDAAKLTEILNEVFGVEDESKTGGYYYYFSRAPQRAEIGRLYGKVRFTAEPSRNAIIVTTNSEENFRIIEAFIEEIDRVSPDMTNTLVVELKHANAEDVAQQLNVLFAEAGARAPTRRPEETGPTPYFGPWMTAQGERKEERPISNLIGQVRVVPNSRMNALVITTAIQNFETLRILIEQLDLESPKAFVAVRLIEVTRTNALRVGTRVSSEPTIFESDDFDEGLKATLGLSREDLFERTRITSNDTVRTTTNTSIISGEVKISALVQFLQRTFDSRVLAEPTICMNNNNKSTLFVGSQIPFIKASLNTPEGGRSDSFEYKDAGTKLEIESRINKADYVVMKLKLESSQMRPGEVLFGGFIVDTRTFDTEVAVQNGQTIVLGGILRQQEVETIRRVPVLGYIPLLRLLFRKKDTSVQTTELLAFITPTVLRTGADVEAVTQGAASDLKETPTWQTQPGMRDSHGGLPGRPPKTTSPANAARPAPAS